MSSEADPQKTKTTSPPQEIETPSPPPPTSPDPGTHTFIEVPVETIIVVRSSAELPEGRDSLSLLSNETGIQELSALSPPDPPVGDDPGTEIWMPAE